jgi:hypothetical protein
MTDWINCTDRLPEIDVSGWSDLVLVYMRDTGEVMAANLTRESSLSYWEVARRFSYKLDAVSHWMPLPAPPRPEA